MSKAENSISRTLDDLLKKKQHGEKIAVITCYDAAFARLVDQTQMDMVLVGDSLGNVVLGYSNTISVKLSDMIYHTRSVSRILTRPFLVTDLPFGSYATEDDAIHSAVRLIQEGGAHAVKLEGGRTVVAQVKKIVAAGIPVIGHLGLTPQSVHALSGYKVQGRTIEAANSLLEDARALEEAGASMIVLELVPDKVAEEVSQALTIPTIGIGAGPSCDGQVLVLHDILGFDDAFKPKFLKRYADLGKIVVEALDAYISDVKHQEFPTNENSYT